MIKFIEIDKSVPYLTLKKYYDLAHKNNQSVIEAFLIASYSDVSQEVDARYVNLKFIQDKEFIFFSNYMSPKSQQFKSHSQISCVIYWSSINVQIRMKGVVSKKSSKFNNEYFLNRSKEKNALAVSSNQSQRISSYHKVLNNYKKALKDSNLNQCPKHWGGFSFIPYYFEFWQGHQSRINKRDVYELNKETWIHSIIEP